jgi:ABC-type polysaccharide/polyol phosphate transport system ATPase subunit
MLTGQRGLTTGQIVTRGRVVALNELGLGFDPVLTGRENAYINASIYGVPRKNLEPAIDAIIDFAGIGEFIDSSVQTYSSGMKARLGFSIATHLEPDILIVDEVLAVGDLAFRRKCVKHIQEFLRRGGSMVLVAHDPYLIQTVCNRVLVMEKGRVVFDGEAIEGVDLHFQLGHTAALEQAGRRNNRVAVTCDDPDEQSFEGNWLSSEKPVADTLGKPSDEQPVVIDGLDLRAEGDYGLVTGCSAIVTLRCRSLIVAKVGWAFSICTGDMQTNVSSFVLGLDGRSATIHAGENEFRCRIPKFPLRPGAYALRAGVTDLATFMPIATLGYHNAPSVFNVESDRPNRTDNLRSFLDDLVSIDAEWL